MSNGAIVPPGAVLVNVSDTPLQTTANVVAATPPIGIPLNADSGTYGNTLIDTTPGPPKLLNSASGGMQAFGISNITDISSTVPGGLAMAVAERARVFPNLADQQNPFIYTPQTGRLRAFCSVSRNGFDITDRLLPFLLSVRIVDSQNPEATIEIDDRYGRLPIPPAMGGILRVTLGWMNEPDVFIFDGWIKDIEYAFTRGQGGGRRMVVSALGLNMNAKVKEPGNDNMGDGAPPGSNTGPPIPLPSWLKKAAAMAGITVNTGAEAQKFLRDHWDRNNESIIELVQREANRAGLLHHWHSGYSVDVYGVGEGATGLVAQAGVNLVNLRIKPFSVNGAWAAGRQQYYDQSQAQWKFVDTPISLPGIQGIANYVMPGPASNELDAKADANGGANLASLGAGHGRICINGEPTARWLAQVQVIGVRSGVDGTYVCMDAVEHIYSRQGYFTWLDVITMATATSGANVYESYFSSQNPVVQNPANALSTTAAATQASPANALPAGADTGVMVPGIPSPVQLPTFSPPPLPLAIPSLPGEVLPGGPAAPLTGP